MFHNNLHRDERGQTALETAIILIAFVVVASVFAFTVLSAGQVSTEKGEEAIYAGLETVESSMSVKGAVIAQGAAGALTNVIFTVQLVSEGQPVDLTSAAANQVVRVGYRDLDEYVNNAAWTVAWIGQNDGDEILEGQELAEITVSMGAPVTSAPGPSEAFTIELKPPTGSVLNISRTTPPSIEAVMELR